MFVLTLDIIDAVLPLAIVTALVRALHYWEVMVVQRHVRLVSRATPLAHRA